jgi:hypothetical protein
MYLSDLMVAAYKEGGEECVAQTARVLTRLPSDWWNVRGCKNWLVIAMRNMEENPAAFFKKLETYLNSKEYSAGKSLEEQLDS